MFSFEPLIFSTTPRWAKKTNEACQHLGITFGSSENTIYAYNYDSATLKVSRIVDSSSSPSFSWTYGFSGSTSTDYAKIAHKAIDSGKDLVFITGW